VKNSRSRSGFFSIFFDQEMSVGDAQNSNILTEPALTDSELEIFLEQFQFATNIKQFMILLNLRIHSTNESLILEYFSHLQTHIRSMNKKLEWFKSIEFMASVAECISTLLQLTRATPVETIETMRLLIDFSSVFLITQIFPGIIQKTVKMINMNTNSKIIVKAFQLVTDVIVKIFNDDLLIKESLIIDPFSKSKPKELVDSKFIKRDLKWFNETRENLHILLKPLTTFRSHQKSTVKQASLFFSLSLFKKCHQSLPELQIELSQTMTTALEFWDIKELNQQDLFRFIEFKLDSLKLLNLNAKTPNEKMEILEIFCGNIEILLSICVCSLDEFVFPTLESVSEFVGLEHEKSIFEKELSKVFDSYKCDCREKFKKKIEIILNSENLVFTLFELVTPEVTKHVIKKQLRLLDLDQEIFTKTPTELDTQVTRLCRLLSKLNLSDLVVPFLHTNHQLPAMLLLNEMLSTSSTETINMVVQEYFTLELQSPDTKSAFLDGLSVSSTLLNPEILMDGLYVLLENLANDNIQIQNAALKALKSFALLEYPKTNPLLTTDIKLQNHGVKELILMNGDYLIDSISRNLQYIDEKVLKVLKVTVVVCGASVVGILDDVLEQLFDVLKSVGTGGYFLESDVVQGILEVLKTVVDAFETKAVENIEFKLDVGERVDEQVVRFLISMKPMEDEAGVSAKEYFSKIMKDKEVIEESSGEIKDKEDIEESSGEVMKQLTPDVIELDQTQTTILQIITQTNAFLSSDIPSHRLLVLEIITKSLPLIDKIPQINEIIHLYWDSVVLKFKDLKYIRLQVLKFMTSVCSLAPEFTKSRIQKDVLPIIIEILKPKKVYTNNLVDINLYELLVECLKFVKFMFKSKITVGVENELVEILVGLLNSGQKDVAQKSVDALKCVDSKGYLWVLLCAGMGADKVPKRSGGFYSLEGISIGIKVSSVKELFGEFHGEALDVLNELYNRAFPLIVE
jgi:hypothetical protein